MQREQVEKYDQGKGANYYLTKYVTKELCDWGIKIKEYKSRNFMWGFGRAVEQRLCESELG